MPLQHRLNKYNGRRNSRVNENPPLSQTQQRTRRPANEQGFSFKPCFFKLCTAFIVIFVSFSQSLANASEVAVVQSLNIKPYNDVLNGFKSTCSCNVRLFIVSEMTGDDVAGQILITAPDTILTIGINALDTVKTVKNIPIVYSMVLNPQSVISDEKNITGISMSIDPEKQLSAIREILPEVKNIGLLYDPDNMDYFVKKAGDSAALEGIGLTAKKVRSSKKVPETLKKMKGHIDAFWMLPDITVITPETIEFLFLFSIKNRIPVITFSDKYLKMGALLSLGIDSHDIGRQAGDMTRKILMQTEPKQIPRVNARKITTKINKKTAEKLGITVRKIK